MVSSTKRVLPSLVVLFLLQPVFADTLVSTQEEFRQAVSNAAPGDTIVMADGEWNDFEILLSGVGTSDQPITLTAQTKGQVIVTGRSNLRLEGEYLVVSGLVFRDGYSPTNTVISFRANREQLANNSRITEVVIDHFNNPERHETDFWVMMYGRHNRFDHNYLVGKSNNGVTMAVRLDSEDSRENYHRIDHNYFGPRPILGSNGGETLRIGTSRYSLTDSFTVVENNFFDRCNGEVEIISSKSGNNTFRGNVFYESRGTLTLRHGNDNLLENNVFLGNGVDHTGGIRVINKRQTVRNNYMAGLTGHRFGGAFVVMNGVPNSPINRYHQVEESVIENNTIIESDHIELAAGADDERSARILSTTFQKNLITNTNTKNSIAVHDDISGISFNDNIATGILEFPSDQGFEERPITLVTGTNGLLYPDMDIGDVGVSKSLTVIDRDETGPSWYPKPGYENAFDGGNVVAIAAGVDTLTEAVENSQAGDIIELFPGEYIVSKFLSLDHPLTIKGVSNGNVSPIIKYERTTLFELIDGGSLKLEGIVIDGSIAPDTYGNSAIRTSRYSMLGNYQLHLDNVQVRNLNTNHSFNFLKVAMHTMASDIEINNSVFEDITGHIIALDRETDDLGIYNAEYVSINNSSFTNVEGSLASIYRGGTDESTFGPHFSLNNSILNNVGSGNRNSSQSSLYLLGVQATSINNNQFSNSAPIRVIHTVGEPVTSLSGNEFSETSAPSISDYQRPVL
ncbi:MAG: alginate lyase [Pseudomonadales bacterium]|nr:alginate lyase [Pseudomonadales bacterium]